MTIPGGGSTNHDEAVWPLETEGGPDIYEPGVWVICPGGCGTLFDAASYYLVEGYYVPAISDVQGEAYCPGMVACPACDGVFGESDYAWDLLCYTGARRDLADVRDAEPETSQPGEA